MALLSAWIAPYPISANRYWRKTKTGRVYVSKEAQAFKKQFMPYFSSVYDVLYCDVEVHIKLSPKLNKNGTASKRVLDLDNCIKVTLDALNGVAWADDRQVKKLVVVYGTPVINGSLCVEVYKAEF